jgi:WD40 repeat protein
MKNRVAGGLVAGLGIALSLAWAEPGTTALPTKWVLRGHKGAIWSVTWSLDGRQLASVDVTERTIRLWDMRSARQIKRIARPGGGFQSVYWTARGLLAVLERKDDVVLWNATRGRAVVPLPTFVGGWVSWDRAGRRLAVWGQSSGVWDLVAGKFLTGLGMDTAGAAFSPDGKRLAVVTDVGNVRVIDAGTGLESRVLQSYIGWDFGHSPRPVAWSPDGKRVAAATFRTPEPDDVVRVWQVDTATELFTHPDKGKAIEGGCWRSPGAQMESSWLTAGISIPRSG